MKPVKKALRDKKSAGNSQERTSKHSSYRDDHKKEGKGAGKKGGKDKGKKETHGETDKKPCRFYNTAGSTTPLGVAPAVRSALFSHEGPGGSQRGAGPGLQLPNVSDLSSVGGKAALTRLCWRMASPKSKTQSGQRRR